MDAGLASLESLLVINMKSLFHQYMKSLIVCKKLITALFDNLPSNMKKIVF